MKSWGQISPEQHTGRSCWEAVKDNKSGKGIRTLSRVCSVMQEAVWTAHRCVVLDQYRSPMWLIEDAKAFSEHSIFMTGKKLNSSNPCWTLLITDMLGALNASLGSLFQCLTTLPVRKCFLMPSLNPLIEPLNSPASHLPVYSCAHCYFIWHLDLLSSKPMMIA